MTQTKSEVLVTSVKKAIREVRRGSPLKDFLDDEEIISALKLLLHMDKKLKFHKSRALLAELGI